VEAAAAAYENAKSVMAMEPIERILTDQVAVIHFWLLIYGKRWTSEFCDTLPLYEVGVTYLQPFIFLRMYRLPHNVISRKMEKKINGWGMKLKIRTRKSLVV
jgi:hypothetical protein